MEQQHEEIKKKNVWFQSPLFPAEGHRTAKHGKKKFLSGILSESSKDFLETAVHYCNNNQKQCMAEKIHIMIIIL